MAKIKQQRQHQKQQASNRLRLSDNDSMGSNSILVTLDAGKRYAHTAPCTYQILMASLQPDSRKQPNCACSIINKEGRKYKFNNGVISDDQVIVIIEHDLKEHILCILDKNKVHSYKLNLIIQPGEQIAYRTIGRIPVLLSGVSAVAH